MINVILFLILYAGAGYGLYYIAFYEAKKQERKHFPPVWLIIVWPIVILLGINDLIDWIIKKLKGD